MFSPIARNFDTDQSLQEVYDFNLRIFEEDRAIVEAQKPENLPLNPKIEVNIPADRSSVAYRRGLRGLARLRTAPFRFPTNGGCPARRRPLSLAPIR